MREQSLKPVLAHFRDECEIPIERDANKTTQARATTSEAKAARYTNAALKQ